MSKPRKENLGPEDTINVSFRALVRNVDLLQKAAEKASERLGYNVSQAQYVAQVAFSACAEELGIPFPDLGRLAANNQAKAIAAAMGIPDKELQRLALEEYVARNATRVLAGNGAAAGGNKVQTTGITGGRKNPQATPSSVPPRTGVLRRRAK